MFSKPTVFLGLCVLLLLWHAAPSQSAGIPCEELWRKYYYLSCNADNQILTERCQRIHRRLVIKDCYRQGNAQDTTTSPEAPEATTLGEAPEATTLGKAPEATTLGEAPEATTIGEASETTTLPEAPETTTSSEAPEATTLGNAQDTTTSPEAPEATSSGEAPEATTSPESLEATTSPEAQEATTSPEAPEATTLGEAPEATTIGEAPEATTIGEASETTTLPEAPETTTSSEAPEATKLGKTCTWTEFPNKAGHWNQIHGKIGDAVETLRECQTLCEEREGCVAVDFFHGFYVNVCDWYSTIPYQTTSIGYMHAVLIRCEAGNAQDTTTSPEALEATTSSEAPEATTSPEAQEATTSPEAPEATTSPEAPEATTLVLCRSAPSQSRGITCEELWRRFDHHSCNADDLTKRCQRIYRRLGIKDCLGQGNTQDTTTSPEAPEATSSVLCRSAPSQSRGITCEELWRRFNHHSCNADDLAKRCQRIYRRLGIKDCLGQGNAQDTTTSPEAPEATSSGEAPEATTSPESLEATTSPEAQEATTSPEAPEATTLGKTCTWTEFPVTRGDWNQIKGTLGVNLETLRECQTLCEEREGCVAVDFYDGLFLNSCDWYSTYPDQTLTILSIHAVIRC